MACNPNVLTDVPLFSLLDEEVLAMLASQVELHDLAPSQRIYKIGEPSTRAFVMASGAEVSRKVRAIQTGRLQ